jgi:hypothetical protein
MGTTATINPKNRRNKYKINPLPNHPLPFIEHTLLRGSTLRLTPFMTQAPTETAVKHLNNSLSNSLGTSLGIHYNSLGTSLGLLCGFLWEFFSVDC